MHRSDLNSVMADSGKVVFFLLYQIGLLATLGMLAYQNWGRCAAVFNCIVIVAADLFKATFWPVYWTFELLV